MSKQSANRFVRLALVCLGVGLGVGLGSACTSAPDRDDQRVGVTSAALLTIVDCPAGYNVILGNSASNTINGTSGSDCILGLGGNDTIHGHGGNDFLVGGTGNDKLYGGDGNDVLHGEDGIDRLDGQGHNDTLFGSIGSDNLIGGSGNDAMYAGESDDEMDGNAGDDLMFGGSGVDWISGSDGNDRMFGEGGDDHMYGDGGDDIMDGGADDDECWAGAGHDVVTGGAGNDLLVGDEGSDFMSDDSGSDVMHGGSGGMDSCSGWECELPEPEQSGCTATPQCAASETCVSDVGMCLPCGTVGGVGCNSADDCPSDPNKTEPGICGCGVADTDSDADGTADCLDACPSDPAKIAAGVCGCGVADTDSDADGTADCNDLCPSDPAKIAAGVCGCGVADTDSDADGTADCNDLCPSDPAKVDAGVCGCGVADIDSDGDGTLNCNDACPSDPAKVTLGACGCGVPDTDSDSDGVADCNDVCPGHDDAIDTDSDGTPDGCENPCALGPTTIVGNVSLTGTPSAAALAVFDGIECITGDLTFNRTTLEDLSAFSSLQVIEGDLTVFENEQLLSVEGLRDLERIGGYLTILNNDALADLNGLEGLSTLGAPENEGAEAFLITGNLVLGSCWPDKIAEQTGKICERSLTASDCVGNNGPSDSCTWAPSPSACAPGATGPGILDGSFITLGPISQAERDSLAGITCITGDVEIYATTETDLELFSSLEAIGGYLFIYLNDSLASLDGLENLRFVRGTVDIESNAITNVDGLSGLDYAGEDFVVRTNASLANVAGLGQLESIGGLLLISDNAALPACWVEAIEEATGVDCGAPGFPCTNNGGTGTCSHLPPGFVCADGATGAYVYDGDIFVTEFQNAVRVYGMVDGVIDNSFTNGVVDLADIECVTGLVQIESAAVTDLAPLDLVMVGGDFYMFDTAATDLDGLDGLSFVGGQLIIGGNNQLTGLAELSSLSSLGTVSNPTFDLAIFGNAQLHACWVPVIETQTGTTCGSGSLPCTGNDGTVANCE